jgi:DNA-binding NtrC family response regulator
MDVIITKKYSFSNQPFAKLFGLKVGLIDNDNQARSFYKQKLKEANLEVVTFADYVEALATDKIEEFNALVFGLQTELIKEQFKHLQKFIESFPHVPVVTISKTMQENQIDAIMKLGTRLHINRDFSHPRDLIVALEQIL